MVNYYLTYDKKSFSEELLKSTEKLGLCFCLEKILDYVKEVCYNYGINTPLITIKDKDIELSYEDKEIEARAWSSSLFYSVFPNDYLELAEQGKIKFV